MRIGFFTDGFLPQPNGVATSVYESAKELGRRGHEVFVIAPKYPGYVDSGINVIRLRSLKISKQPEMRIALSIPDNSLRRVLSMDFDIIHGHSGGPITLLGWEIARSKKIPYVVTYHTLWNRYAHYFLKGKIVTPKIIERATKIFGNRADHLIAPTKRVEEELKSYGVKKPITVVPSGIDTGKFKNAKEGFLKSKINLRNKPILLYVGRLGREKSVDFIIGSFVHVNKQNKNAHLVLIGDGPEKKKLKLLAKNLGVEKNTHFLGEVKNEEVQNFYKDAAVFVFSSTTETQGLVVPEALSAGVPVVAIDDPAFECIKNGENGFLVKRDKKEFASKILSILENDKLRETMAKNALESSRKLSVVSTVDSFERIYFGLLDKYNKESIYKTMGQNERKEQLFVVNIAFWLAIASTRFLTFLSYTPADPYPKLIFGVNSFYHFTFGVFLILISFSTLLKRRSFTLASLSTIGLGLAWTADELWSILGMHKTANDYWNIGNLAPIFIAGAILLGFLKMGRPATPKIYISTREKHDNPVSPKATVVIPAYNEEKFIDTVLKSLVNQTFKNFELIVVDNNSMDKTGEVAEKYGARVIVEKNKGVANARQAGFFASKGEIIATTDSDSVVPENWLEKIVEKFSKEKELVGFGGLSTLYSGPVSARAAGRYLFPLFWITDKVFSGGWNLAGFNMAVRKSAFVNIGGFNTDLTLGEDVDLAQRLRKVGKVDIDKALAVFVSGRRFKNGLLPGVMTYAPSWFMRVIFKKDKFLKFPTIRSEKISNSKLAFLPLGIVAVFILSLFYISNPKLPEKIKTTLNFDKQQQEEK